MAEHGGDETQHQNTFWEVLLTRGIILWFAFMWI